MNITITGNLGSGKSSIAKLLKEKGYEIVSTGRIFRQLAMDKGLSVEEFNRQVNEAASKGDRSVDKMIDDTTTKIGAERDRIVFDSRLAWHFAPQSFKVFVITDIDEASRRVFNDSLRAGSESYESQEACKKALINRQKLETVRYKEIYDIDYYDMSNYNLVIESTNAVPAELAQEILDKMETYQAGGFEKLMELNPTSIRPAQADEDREKSAREVSVIEKGGVFTLSRGSAALENALKNNIRFIPVRLAASEPGGDDSFMNFAGMV
ncbi:MAG: dephospho-CoA kinase [Roseburia sp.]|nr:dephospho-CoA kinase [Roseburia sp.]